MLSRLATIGSTALGMATQLAVGVGLGLGVTAASAVTVNITDASSRAVGENIRAVNNSNGIDYSESGMVGSYKVSDGLNSFWVFCLSVFNNYQANANYVVTSLDNFITGGAYAAQFNSAHFTDGNVPNDYHALPTAQVLSNIKTLVSHAYAETLSSQTNSAALAYAIWEVEGDPTGNPYNAATGGLRLASADAVAVRANQYLSALAGNVTWASLGLGAATNYNYIVYQNTPAGGSQSFLSVTVPEPTTLALLAACGLGWMGSARTRRRVQTSTM